MRFAAGSGNPTCDYCKSILLADKDDEGVSTLEEAPDQTCPVCAIPLWNSMLAGVRIQSCKKCRGLLIAMGVFEDLIGQLRVEDRGNNIPQTAELNEMKRKINCPFCHRPMDAHFYYGGGSVVIDGCDKCELNWLDHGELMRIVRAPHTTDA
jgi:Zn-finger nucleic acid-binding protein